MNAEGKTISLNFARPGEALKTSLTIKKPRIPFSERLCTKTFHSFSSPISPKKYNAIILKIREEMIKPGKNMFNFILFICGAPARI